MNIPRKFQFLNLLLVLGLLLQPAVPVLAAASAPWAVGSFLAPTDRTIVKESETAASLLPPLPARQTKPFFSPAKTPPALQAPHPAPVYAIADAEAPRTLAAEIPNVSLSVPLAMVGDAKSAIETNQRSWAKLLPSFLREKNHVAEAQPSANRELGSLLAAYDTMSVPVAALAEEISAAEILTLPAIKEFSSAPQTIQVEAASTNAPMEAVAWEYDDFQLVPALAQYPGDWIIGNIVGLNCGTLIREGPGDTYTAHTTVPEDNWTVMVIGGPRLVDGQVWWDTSRAAAGDPSGGTGWVSQSQSEGASCSGGGGGGGGPTINWAVDEIIGLCTGTEIRHGPGLVVHTIVPEDDWLVKIIGGPRSYNGQTWWDTSRFEAGDPSGGTGWVSQEQTEAVCGGAPGDPGYLGPLPLSPELRALLKAIGYEAFLRFFGDPVSASTGVLTHKDVDLNVPGVAGFDLVLERVYNSADERDGAFGVGWSSLLDMVLRIANDGSIDVRYPDGHGAYFVLDGDAYVPGQDGVFDSLVYDDASGFELTTPEQVHYLFDKQGILTSLQDRHGNTIMLERDGDDHVTRIVDSGGRQFNLTYDGDHVATIVDPLGRTLQYTYSSDDLVAFTDANGGVHRFEYSGHRMTRLTDPENITYLQNTYDGEGRVIEQIDASGSHSTVVYGASSTAFTDNLGNTTTYSFDDKKRVTRIEDALSNAEIFVYDDEDNVTAYTDKRGQTWTYTYDDRGNQLTETDPLGGVASTTYNATNDVTGMADAIGHTSAYEYNGTGDVIRITYADDSQSLATYDGKGQMLTRTDANGNTTIFAYDATGNLIQATDPLGHSTQFSYDAVGRQTSITDANGHTAQFVYDGNDNVVQIVDPKGQASSFAYDLNDNLTRMTDRRGGIWLYGYDENLKLISETDPVGHVTTHDYDLMYNRISSTDPRGNTTSYAYDDLYQLTQVTDAQGGVTAYTYDPNGNVTSTTDALGFITGFTFDELNRLTQQTDALGGVTAYAYDAVSRLTSFTNPRDATTEFEYDLQDRRVLERDALGGEWHTGYDAVGNTTSVTDADGHVISFVYDSANRLISQIDGEGHITRFGYDGVGNRTSITDGRGFATTFSFDANDNLTAITDPLAGVTAITYDAEDNLVSQTDPSGHKTQYVYALDGLLTSMTDAEGFVSSYGYDAAHNLTTLTNPNGKSWTFVYDSLNRRISQTDPLGGVATYAYDALGQQVRMTDENGVATRSDYDALGRLVAQVRNEQAGQPSDQQTNITFVNAFDSVGNRISTTDANGNVTSYEFDLLDRLTKQTDAENQITTYQYDGVGNLTKLTNPRGFVTDFGYNGDDQLVSITDALSQVWGFQYDAAHNRTTVTDPHNVVTHSDYDGLNRLTAQVQNYRAGVTPDSEINVTTAYTYYADSTLASMTDPNGNVTLYRHDGLHRPLEEEDAQGGITRNAYDGVGNLLSVTDANNHTTTHLYDALNRRTATTDPDGHAQRYVYDAVGNLTVFTNGRNFSTTTQYDRLYRPVKVTDAKSGEINAIYDAMGNLLTLTDQNGHPQSFTYDKVNRTLSHTDAEGYLTGFAYDANSNRTSLTDGNGHVTAFAFDALDRMTSTTNAEGEVTRFGYNALGNRTHMTENDGVVTLYDYDPIYRLAAVTLNSLLAALPDHETNVLFDYSYDANGNLLAISDPLVHITHFVYDSLGRMVQETNPLGNGWHYTYDPVGNLSSRLDANGDLTQYTYTADDLLHQISYPDSTVVKYAYDANHNRIQMVDNLGTATWSYDELDRMTATTDSLGRVLAYALDPVGNRTAITYADGRTVNYSYLDNDWLKSVTDPQGGITNYTRDGVGLATLTVNPNDTVAETSYDKANRMLSVVNRQVVGAKKTISAFHYSLDDVGQRQQTVAEYGWRNPPTVTNNYQYDPLRRLVRMEQSDKKETIWTEYDFDAAGNRTALRTNDDAFSPKPFDSQALIYTYNDANQLLTILGDTHPGQGPAQKTAEKVAQALQAFRHEVSAQRGKHISEAAADALLTQADALIGQIYAAKPPKQNVIAAAITALHDAVTAYRVSNDIDSDGIKNSLLVKLDKAGAANSGGVGAPGVLQTEIFAYDANGNRINNQFPGPQGPQIQGTDYTYDYENRLLRALDYQGNRQARVTSASAATSSLSNQVFLPSISTQVFSSADTTLTARTQVNRAVTDMLYDGIGRRLVMTYDPKNGASGAKRTEYVFENLDPVAEYDLWDGHQRNFYRGDLNRMLSMQSFPSSQMSWYAYDGLGSVTGLTKDKGQSVHNYRYDVYGSVIPINGGWTEPHNTYTYTGQEWVESLGMLHFYARDYDPVAGVWMQQDPYRGRLMEPVSLHRYGYVGAEPIGEIDIYGYDRGSSFNSVWRLVNISGPDLLGPGNNVMNYLLNQMGIRFGTLFSTNMDTSTQKVLTDVGSALTLAEFGYSALEVISKYQGYRNNFIRVDWISGLANGSYFPSLDILKNSSGNLRGVVQNKQFASLAGKAGTVAKRLGQIGQIITVVPEFWEATTNSYSAWTDWKEGQSTWQEAGAKTASEAAGASMRGIVKIFTEPVKIASSGLQWLSPSESLDNVFGSVGGFASDVGDAADEVYSGENIYNTLNSSFIADNPVSDWLGQKFYEMGWY